MYDIISKIRVRQAMFIYMKNNAAKFHPDRTWNDAALCFFEEVAPTRTTRTR